MTLKPLCAFMMVSMPLAGLHAAALDRSGQSTAAFFQKGNYAELGASGLMPKVSGTDSSGNAVPEMAEDYEMYSAALKFEVSPESSFAILYDQPFGAAAEYQGQNRFVAETNNFSDQLAVRNSAIGVTGRTTVEVDSHNATFLYGYQPIPDVTLFGGPAIQSISGELNLRGPAYSSLNGYTAKLQQDNRLGYVAGFAFEKPEIALRLAVTYRSEIEHRLKTSEAIALPAAVLARLTGVTNQLNGVTAQLNTVTGQLTQVNGGLAQVNGGLAQVRAGLTADPTNAALLAQQTALVTQQTTLLGQQAQLVAGQGQLQAGQTQLQAGQALLAGQNAVVSQLPSQSSGKTEITTPQSVNIDFQTGIMADTLAFANVRWVNWESFAIKPELFAKVTGLQFAGGLDVVNYAKDQWSANVGVGRKLHPQLSGSVSVGWDSGAGNPVTTLGPTEGFWNVGLGARYSPVENVDLSLGVRYLFLGDAEAKVSSGTIVGNFENNDALAVGLKMGYHF